MKTIVRSEYLQHLKDFQGAPDIKIITGLRRSEKIRIDESIYRMDTTKRYKREYHLYRLF